jgi:hypothetical protein
MNLYCHLASTTSRPLLMLAAEHGLRIDSRLPRSELVAR